MKELYEQITASIFQIDPPLNYEEIQHALIKLTEAIHDDDDEFLFDLGEGNEATLGDIIIGAYWHFTSYHKGQESLSYATLCALGTIFQPGMAQGPEEDSAEMDVHDQLEALATDHT